MFHGQSASEPRAFFHSCLGPSVLTRLEERTIGGYLEGVGSGSTGKGDDRLELARLGCRRSGCEAGKGSEDGNSLEVLHFYDGMVGPDV